LLSGWERFGCAELAWGVCALKVVIPSGRVLLWE